MSASASVDPNLQAGIYAGQAIGQAMFKACEQVNDEIANHAYVLATMQEFFRRCEANDKRDVRAKTSREVIAQEVKQDADAYAAAFGFHSHQKEST